MGNMTLREFAAFYAENKEAFVNGTADRKLCIKAGWYDWFCEDKSLARKTAKLAPKVLKLMKSPKVNIDTMYVFFKNNCPMKGPLYDSFSFCYMNGEVAYWVTPKSGHTGLAEVWDVRPGVKQSGAVGKWRDVLTFFGV